MSWITDGSGTRWVEIPQKKRRKSPRALKFGSVKVGDQLVKTYQKERKSSIYYLVTDLWFDPVLGQEDELKGSMVGYAQIKLDGSAGRKSSTTIRGLASQQFDYADIDYIALCEARKGELESGKVVEIGRGKVIRKRPKNPGHRL